jgi:hypothetical protein
MKIKLQIKSIYGIVLFEFEKEDNSIKETVIEAIKFGANLSRANLYGANLSGANLSGANLSRANLSGANLSGIKIKKAVVLSGLYKYIVIPFISEDDEKYVKMGCFTRKLSEWESDFWNNNNEFPNDNSEQSNLRLFAFETANKWFEIVK